MDSATAWNGDLVGISDPELGPLADDGGPTQTMALLPGSPAIGAGTAVSGVTTDQRGQPLDTPTPDVGAYQAQSSSSLTGLTFSGLSSPSIGFGTAGVTISGTLANGAQAPQGESLAITLNGVSQQATIGAGGAFSTRFDTSKLAVSGSPYTVSYSYAGDTTFGAATDTEHVEGEPRHADGASHRRERHLHRQSLHRYRHGHRPGRSRFGQPRRRHPDADLLRGDLGHRHAPFRSARSGRAYTVVAAFPGSSDYEPVQSAVTFTIEPAASWAAR